MPTALIVQFATTFGVWIAAEAIGLSGILTLVAFAMTMARRGRQMPAQHARADLRGVGDGVFVLNAFAFVLIGMQLRPIWERSTPAASAPGSRFRGRGPRRHDRGPLCVGDELQLADAPAP